MQQTRDLEGVYFSKEAYAGFWRRLLIDFVDITVMVLVSIILTMSLSIFLSSPDSLLTCLLITLSPLWFSYFVLLKRTETGTIGYRIGKVRIVNLRGERPGIFTLTIRLIFTAAGPINFLYDLIWLSGDRHKQALRDKLAQTYVVRKDADPAGTGKLAYGDYDIWGWRFVFREVKIEDSRDVAT